MPLDDQRGIGNDQGPLAAEELGTDDGLDHAGFVFHGDEDDTVGRPRALADDDGPRGTDPLPFGQACQRSDGGDASGVEGCAEVAEQVWAGGQMQPGVVGDGCFKLTHLGQR